MSAIRIAGAVFARELSAYFLSPIAWIVIFLFLLVNGITFNYFTTFYQGNPRQITLVVESLFSFSIVWILLLSPILTMRLFAEEKRAGSLELLMTAPVTETQVVAGKFVAAQAFFCLIWLSLLPLLVILEVLGALDWGPVAATFVGLCTLGCLTNALGLLASTVTRNQLISAILALTGNLFFFYVGLLQSLFPEDALDVRRVFHYLSFTSHFEQDYLRGMIDLRYFFFYLSFAAVFLFLAVRALEARKSR